MSGLVGLHPSMSPFIIPRLLSQIRKREPKSVSSVECETAKMGPKEADSRTYLCTLRHIHGHINHPCIQINICALKNVPVNAKTYLCSGLPIHDTSRL